MLLKSNIMKQRTYTLRLKMKNLIHSDILMMPYKIIGIDTETHRGRAVLLCTPTRYLLPRTFDEIYDFLLKDGHKFCAFYVDYDARAILRFLPRKILTELALFHSTRYKDFSITYFSKKFLRISLLKKTIIIYDCYQFYHSTLDAAAKKMFGIAEGKTKIPRTWLTKMKSLLRDPRHRKKVIEYCMKDAELCERLMLAVQTQFDALGIDFSHPASKGALAARTFKDKIKSPLKPWQNDFYRKSFHGGRIEVFQRGIFHSVKIYDINSAYPHALAQFYDPRELHLKIGKNFNPHCAYGMYHVRIRQRAGYLDRKST